MPQGHGELRLAFWGMVHRVTFYPVPDNIPYIVIVGSPGVENITNV
jgi:hypothetical protein